MRAGESDGTCFVLSSRPPANTNATFASDIRSIRSYLQIPLHAFPALKEAKRVEASSPKHHSAVTSPRSTQLVVDAELFPTRMDLGNCKLGNRFAPNSRCKSWYGSNTYIAKPLYFRSLQLDTNHSCSQLGGWLLVLRRAMRLDANLLSVLAPTERRCISIQDSDAAKPPRFYCFSHQRYVFAHHSASMNLA